MNDPEIHPFALSQAERLHDGNWLGDEASVELFFTQTQHSTWTFGPLAVETRLSAAGLECHLYLMGLRIGGGTLGDEDQIGVSAQVALVKAKTLLQADFAKRELWASGEACVRGMEEWSCRQFKTRIFAW